MVLGASANTSSTQLILNETSPTDITIDVRGDCRWEDGEFPKDQLTPVEPLARSNLSQVRAVFLQRWRQIFKTKKILLFQLIAPILVIALGYPCCRVFITLRSPSRLILPSYYESVQKILVNENAVDFNKSDTNVAQVVANLPTVDYFFDVNWANKTVTDNFYTY